MSTRFSNDQIPDQSGKVALVTGANTGIGFESALQLALKNAHVILACRSEKNGTEAIERIKAQKPDAKLEFLKLDLQDMKQVKEAADTFSSTHDRLDILLNNAGIMACPYALSKDGIESQFATNHIGHFVFTMGVMPVLLKTTPPPRIVNVSSLAHIRTKPDTVFDIADINDETKHNTWQRYSTSKLANVLFSDRLAKKLESKGILVNSLHPGVVKTELGRGLMETYGKWFIQGAFFLLGPFIGIIPANDGALTNLYVATSPEVKQTGEYFIPYGKVGEKSKLAKSEELQEQLWKLSIEVVKEKLGWDVSNVVV